MTGARSGRACGVSGASLFWRRKFAARGGVAAGPGWSYFHRLEGALRLDGDAIEHRCACGSVPHCSGDRRRWNGRGFPAVDTRLGRKVALKLVRPEMSSQADFRERFTHEARAISALNHPHICTLYDIGEQAGAAYLVMEYVDGETLAARLRQVRW